jgi:hypothetical protein
MWLFRKGYADVHREQFSESKQSKSLENSLVYLASSILNPEEPLMFKLQSILAIANL